ncbi:MAG TPA: amino acid permease [Candidatus Krumholzibacteria bacterium]|nr:amino acid permease [Candidatus Krumholzibacteria bacterium]
MVYWVAMAVSPAQTPHSSAKVLGIWSCTALVIGNIVGSGVFLLPASLAPYGIFAIVAWVLTSIGALSIALVFARLARAIPRAGGPYAYTRAAYGDFAGFWIAWGYWICLWTGVAAIAVAFGSYLKVFIPALEGNTRLCGVASLAAVWLLVVVNALGIRRASAMQIGTTVLKLLPLIAIAIVGFAWIEPANLTAPVASGTNPFGAISSAATLALWAFLGLESATIPADSVDRPERTIPRATVIGTLVCAVIYISSTVVLMGALPRETLAASQAPFADAARVMWGEWGYYAVGLGAVVSCFGALNGWILVTGQFPTAAARDGLFPARFAQLSPRGVPTFATIIAVALVTIMLVLNYSGSQSLVSIFNFAILLSTLATLIPYVFCSLAPLLLKRNGIELPPTRARDRVIMTIAFVYSVWAIYGAGAQTVLLGFLLMLVGIPVYVWQRRKA